MKKIIIIFVSTFVLSTGIAFASPVNVNRLNGDHIEPLITADYIKSSYFTATSTTATSTFAGNLTVANNSGFGTTSPMGKFAVAGDEYHYGNYYHFGANVPTFKCVGPTCFDFTGNDNTTNGITMNIQNINAGTSGYAGYTVSNDKADTNLTNFAGFYLNSSTYTDTTFGTAFANPYQALLQNSMGALSIVASTSSVPNSYINFIVGGTNTTNEKMRLTNAGLLGLGTSTPSSLLTVYGSSPIVTIQNSATAAIGNNSTILFKGLRSTGADQFMATIAGIEQSATSNTGDLALSTYLNGSQGEVMRLTSGGNVGVGTTSPATKLQVDGTITTGGSVTGTINFMNTAGANRSTFTFNGSALDWSTTANINQTFSAGASERMRIVGTSGFVGIGTTSPSSLFTVSGSNSNTTLTTYQTSPNISIVNRNGGANTFSPIDFRGTNSAGTEISTSMITGIHTDLTSGSEDGDIAFHDMLAGTFAERMRLEGNNLGLGTTSPGYMLSLAAATGNNWIGVHNSSGTISTNDVIGKLLFTTADASNIINREVASIQTIADVNYVGNDAAATSLAFFTHGQGNNNDPSVERMRVDGSGKVSIGTTTTSSSNTMSDQFVVGIGVPLANQQNKTASFNLATFGNAATSTTPSIRKTGLNIYSVGTWSGSGATNIGLLVSAVSGGTNNYDAIFNGGGNSGFGTSSPYAQLSVQSNASTGDAFVVATSTGNTIGGFDNDGHRFTSGPAPAISSCGTGSGTVVGDDQSGTITTATAATTCTATFSKAYRNTPVCIVTDDSLVGFADISSVSTSVVTFGISSALTGGHLYYQCVYHK